MKTWSHKRRITWVHVDSSDILEKPSFFCIICLYDIKCSNCSFLYAVKWLNFVSSSLSSSLFGLNFVAPLWCLNFSTSCYLNWICCLCHLYSHLCVMMHILCMVMISILTMTPTMYMVLLGLFLPTHASHDSALIHPSFVS